MGDSQMLRKRIAGAGLWLLVLLMITTPVWGMAQVRKPANSYTYVPSEESIYQKHGGKINHSAGTTAFPEIMLEELQAYFYQYPTTAVNTARSYIPGYIVDQYMLNSYQTLGSEARSGDVQAASANAKHTEASYVVEKGDTLYRISKMFGVSVEALRLHNKIADPSKLQIGQVLSIPAVKPDQDLAAWLSSSQQITDVFYATLTAYTAGYESTGKTPSHPAYGITASGAKVKENHTIAVDPDVIPLGSLVYIEGIGLRKAEDTGSAIKGHKIDIYIPDLEEALAFGVKENVRVFVLGPDKRDDVQIASAKP